jgi:hypothetical protein
MTPNRICLMVAYPIMIVKIHCVYMKTSASTEDDGNATIVLHKRARVRALANRSTDRYPPKLIFKPL